MPFIADLHIHSPFSRATSASNRLSILAAWANIKGIDVLATGDFCHPGWFDMLTGELEEAEPGLFRLKDAKPERIDGERETDPGRVRFVLSTEISNIYKKNGKVRKNHNLVFAPDFETAERIIHRLSRIGNLESDGRPILGLDAKHLLELVLESSEHAHLVPAHIWTPWFSLLGSKSGFDSVEECFEDLTPRVFALETGLSSDPAMNWRLSALDRYTLISNSDAHSPQKIGREANCFDCALDYFSLFEALKTKKGYRGTLEFFPEEGKYHLDGHRRCSVVLRPEETRRLGNRCPVCGKPLTIGVMNRVEEIADRGSADRPAGAAGFESLIPLREVLAETLGRNPGTKAVEREYWRVLAAYGSEFGILREVPDAVLRADSNPLLAEAVARMRRGRVIRQAGYDGEYGRIRLFDEAERLKLIGRPTLFRMEGLSTRSGGKEAMVKDGGGFGKPSDGAGPSAEKPRSAKQAVFNPEQMRVVLSEDPVLCVTAGPGTGKTRVLVGRIIEHVRRRPADAAGIVAMTFTNRAAGEMQDRLLEALGDTGRNVTVTTIHRFCLDWLSLAGKRPAAILDEADRKEALAFLGPGKGARDIACLSEEVTRRFRRESGWKEDGFGKELQDGAGADSYRRYLERHGLIDIDHVVGAAVDALQESPRLRKKLKENVRHVFVDEFQDLDANQYALIRLIRPDNGTLFVIGDAAQAIYGFRGASPEFFLRCPKDFQAARVSLSANYRNPPCILRAAESILSGAGGPDRERVRAVSDNPVLIRSFEAASEKGEAEFIVHAIESMVGGIEFFSFDSGRAVDSEDAGTFSFGQFAVLYRSFHEAETLYKRLVSSGIPCQRVGQTPFYRDGVVEPWVRFLRMFFEKGHPASWHRFLKNNLGLRDAVLRSFLDDFDKRNSAGTGEYRSAFSLFPALRERIRSPKKREALEIIQNAARLLASGGSRTRLSGVLEELAPRLRVDASSGPAFFAVHRRLQPGRRTAGLYPGASRHPF
jgi:uncharacterized protein (TIGR00375 family)